MSRMTNDVDNISNTVSSTLGSLVSGVLTIIGCLAIMIWYSPLLTLVSMVSLVLTLLVTAFMSKFMRPLFQKQQSLLGNLNTQTEEMVTGIKTVAAYNHQEIAKDEFNHFSDTYCKVGLKAQIISGSMGPVMNFIGNLGYFLVCFFGAIFAIKGIGTTLQGEVIGAGIIAMFLKTSKQFTRPINEIAQLYSQILTALTGAERVFEILDEKTEDFTGEIKVDSSKLHGDIDFEHVAFGYVKDKPVLKDFTVDVYSGHKIALVGATGSGKTTIVNLLMRFYDATDEEFNRAIEMANCAKFIRRLPEQEKTMLTEGGANLSQGQRQLIAIARAAVADPPVMIMDEATSSIDTRTERQIQNAFDTMMIGRTTFIVAHRLSTIQKADQIIVMNDGHIIEQGKHEELLKKNGFYHNLYYSQFEKPE